MDNISRFIAEIQANIKNFERNIKKAQAQAASLPDEVTVDVDADISKFRRGLLQAKALAQAFSAGDIVKNVRIRFGNSMRNFKNFVSEVDQMNDNFQNELMRLAKMISAVGIVLGNVIKGGLIASFSALIPIVAGATSVFMALGNMLGVTVGNLLAFVGALGVAGAGMAAYGGLVASVISRYNSETFEATEASNRFTNSLEGIQSAWNGIVDMHEDAIFNQMATAIDTAGFALQELTPFIDGVVSAMGRMTGELQTFVQESPTMLRFFDNMNNKGTSVFENIMRGLGGFGAGLVDTLNAAMPLIEWVAQGFNNLGDSFASWADRMAENNGFNDFTNYVMENMPKISTIFGNVFNGIIDLFAAFGENSSNVFDGLVDLTEQFKTWSNTIKESDGFQKFIDYIQQNAPTVLSLIGSLVMIVINFAVAMAPIASTVLNVVAAFASWVAELFKTNPIVAQIIGVITTLAGIFMMLVPSILVVTKVIIPLIGTLIRFFTQSMLVKGVLALLSGAMTLLSGPVGIVIAALTALSAVLILLYDNVEWFRNIVNAVWTFVSNFISQQVQQIITWFNYFRNQGQNIFMAALNAIMATLTTGFAQALAVVIAWVTDVAVQFGMWASNLINTVVTALAQFVVSIATGLANAFTAFVTWTVNVLSSIVAFGVNLVTTIMTAIVNFTANIVSGLVGAAAAFTNWIVNVIASIVSFGANLISTIASAIGNFVVTIATGLASALMEFSSFVISGWQSIIQFGANIVSTITSAIASFVSSIASGLASALSNIASFIASGISSIVSFASNIVSTIASGMASFVSAIASGASSALSSISSFVSSAISSIASFVSNLVSSIASGMSSFISAIASGTSSALSALTSFVSGAISAIVNFASQLVSNITNAMSQFVSAITSGGSQAISSMKSILSNIVSAVTGFVGNMTSAGADLIRGLISGIKNMAGSAVNAAKSVVGDAIAGAKNLLGINSPSRVFRDFGEYTMQGLAIGINRDGDKAVDAVKGIARDMTNSFDPELTGINQSMESEIGSIGANINHSVQDDIDRGIDINQNANINLNLGNRAYRGFAEDIGEENTRVTNLEESYLGGAF